MILSVNTVRKGDKIEVIFESDNRGDLLEGVANAAVEEIHKQGLSGYAIEDISSIVPLDANGEVIRFGTGKGPVRFQRTVRLTPTGIF